MRNFNYKSIFCLRKLKISNKRYLSCLNKIDLNLDIEIDNLEKIQRIGEQDLSFKYNEIIVCKIFNNLNSKNQRHTCRIFDLQKNEIFRTKGMDVFHEHIIHKSKENQSLNQIISFSLKDYFRIDFKRPSLYEYITLKEQQAVSSHFSIITLVPMLLELDKSSKILECGTGSGSMTLFLSESLGQQGELHTFDISKIKALNAKKYFCKWKNSYDLRTKNESEQWPANVKFGFVDFCSDERLVQKFQEYYDAIYLDMSDLDKAVQRAYKLLKKDGRLVINAMHLTQVLKVLNIIDLNKIGLEKEIVIEPSHRFWELRKIKQNTNQVENDLNWVCRLEDRMDEKYKRGGLFFNYWQGYLVKFRKIK